MDLLLNKMIQESGNWLRTLQMAQKNPDHENIHHFRLAIKQLNAFATVIGFPKQKNIHQDAFQFLLKCFKTAGAIRKAELKIEKLTGREGDFVCKLLQKNKETCDKSKIKFIQLLQTTQTADLLKLHTAFTYELERLGSHRLMLRLNKTILSNFKKLNKLISKGHYKREMHNMRIIIRRLLELLNLIGHFEKTSELSALHDLLKELNKKMGNWHDAEDLFDFAGSYSKNESMDSPERSRLAEQLQSEMTLLESEIKELFAKGLESSP